MGTFSRFQRMALQSTALFFLSLSFLGASEISGSKISTLERKNYTGTVLTYAGLGVKYGAIAARGVEAPLFLVGSVTSLTGIAVSTRSVRDGYKDMRNSYSKHYNGDA